MLRHVRHMMVHKINISYLKILLLLMISASLLYGVYVHKLSERITMISKRKWLELYSGSDCEPSRSSWRWPPNDPFDVYDVETGYFDVTLRPIIEPDEFKKDWIEQYVDYLDARLKNHKFNGSRLRQLVQMDELVRLGHTDPNYLLYPQAIDVKPVIESIRHGKPIRQTPINNPEIRILETPRRICGPTLRPNYTSTDINLAPYDLIILYKSCAFCFDDRQMIRTNFSELNNLNNVSIGVVFVVGQPSFDTNQLFNFSGYVYNITVVVPKLDKNNPDMNKKLLLQKLAEESRIYGDLVVGSFLDTYFNLTLKQMTSFRWASCFCRNWTKLFLFIDHDVTINYQNLLWFLRKLPEYIKDNIAGGALFNKQMVMRTESDPKYIKWTISEDEIPWKFYPPYAPGLGYVLGTNVVRDVSIASSFTRFIRLEDVFLGFVMQKLNRIYVAYEGFKNSQYRKDLDKLFIQLTTAASRTVTKN